MSVDWFTFTAQIINFLILVVLLKWFLYGPIIDAIQAREEQIAGRFASAVEREQRAGEEERQFHENNQRFEEEIDRLRLEAKREADQRRKQLVDQARDEVQRKRDEWLTSLDRQRDAVVAEVRDRAATQVIAATRRALRLLADADLEQRMAIQFTRRFSQVTDEQLAAIAEAVRRNGHPVVVRSAAELPDDSQSLVRCALQERFGVEGSQLTFETQPALVCGVELVAGGHKLGWSVNDFLTSLDDDIRDALPEQRRI